MNKLLAAPALLLLIAAAAPRTLPFIHIPADRDQVWMLNERLCFYQEALEEGCGQVIEVSPQKGVMVRVTRLKEALALGADIEAVAQDSIEALPGGKIKVFMRPMETSRSYVMQKMNGNIYELATVKVKTEAPRVPTGLSDLLNAAGLQNKKK